MNPALKAAYSRTLPKYSLAAALRYAMSGRENPQDAGIVAVIDDDLRAAGGNKYRLSPRHSVLIPREALAARALQPYQTTVAGSGAELVANNLRSDLLIEALANRSRVRQLGAQSIGGLVGNVTIPRGLTDATVSWITASGSPVVSGSAAESEGSVDSITAQPSTLSGISKASRQLILQGGELAETVIANAFLRPMAAAIDQAAIQGTGATGQPTGIVNQSGVGTASGASFAHATVVSAVQTIATANAILNSATVGWLAPPAVAGLLAQRQKVVGFPKYIWEGNVDEGTINEHPATSSLNCPASTAICGDWSQALLLSWGDADAIEVEVNRFGASFATGDIQFRIFFSCAVVVRHPQSFVVVSSIT